MKKRVGILTSGGDCPGLNATIRGVAKALYARMGDNVEIIGILNGYSGLINGDYKEMCEDDFRGILTLGGTILIFDLLTQLLAFLFHLGSRNVFLAEFTEILDRLVCNFFCFTQNGVCFFICLA